ncbi:VCBS domain-containing protein [Aeromonas hydrophila]|nr:VCBS domain-containing protein [Aeromonas hydrophila]MDD9226612.1 VCBS domain-containing protein [Aeromonas hydrophila]
MVKSVDGTEHTVTVTITGTNDKAIISGDAEGAVTEGNGNIVLSDSGTLTAVDVDGKDADNTFRTDVAAVAHPTEGAPLGSLTITEGGAWTYNVDNSRWSTWARARPRSRPCGQVRGRHRTHRHRHHHRHQRQGDHQRRCRGRSDRGQWQHRPE